VLLEVFQTRWGSVQQEIIEARTDLRIPIVIEKLPPGEYSISAKMGGLCERVRVDATVTARTVSFVTLDLSQLDELRWCRGVRVFGSISSVDPLEFDRLGITLTQICEGIPREDRPPYYAIVRPSAAIGQAAGEDQREAKGVQPGDYALAISPLGFAGLVSIPSCSDRRIDLQLPGKAEVVVRLVDEASGKSVGVDGLLWFPVTSERVPLAYPRRTEFDDSEKVHRFECMPGRVALVALSDEFSRRSQEHFVVGSGLNEISILLNRPAMVHLTLVEGSVRVDMDPEWWQAVIAKDDKDIVAEILVSPINGGPDMQLALTPPGQYELFFPSIEGFKPIRPIDVTAAVGETARITIALSVQ
jgi:hypothetical protein